MKEATSTKSKYNKKDIVAEIIEMRLGQSCSTRTIINYLTQSIGMSKPTAYEYLKWAREEIKEQYDLLNPSAIEEAIGQYEEAIEIARLNKNWKLWNELRRELNKIMGLNAPQKVDITSGGLPIINIITKNDNE
jgi:hypothetical protein